MKLRPAIVVVAAGRGSRFDARRSKLAQDLGPDTVLGHTLTHAVETGLPVVAVVTPLLAEEAARHVAESAVVVLPEVGSDSGLPLGVGFSIANGVLASPDASGWLILPGDMPMVQPESLQAVASALAQYPVAYAQHRGRFGYPVGFASELYSELVMLSGDGGAKRLMARYPAQGIEVADEGVLLDIDTEADLVALRKMHSVFPAQQFSAR